MSNNDTYAERTLHEDAFYRRLRIIFMAIMLSIAALAIAKVAESFDYLGSSQAKTIAFVAMLIVIVAGFYSVRLVQHV